MLDVGDVEVITDYCRVQGKSIRQAAKTFRVSRNTIRRVLREGVEGFRQTAEPRRRRPRVLLEEHRAFIDAVLEGREGGPTHGKQKHDGLSITNMLREEHGYEGSVSQVRRYIKERKAELGFLTGRVSLDRARDPAACLCEADWTRVEVYLAGILITAWLFVARFRFSGALFVRAYGASDTESLLEALQAAFYWFGGVPRTLQMDNDKCAVAKLLKGRSRKETDAFRAFRAHHGFTAQFTMRQSPDENGGVEATMSPVARWWLTPIPAFTRWAELNEYLLGKCHAYMQHQLNDRSGLVGANFEIEKNLLLPLPRTRYDTARTVRTRVDRQGRFQYRNVLYSVPLAYKGHEVAVRGGGEEVFAYREGRELARHEKRFPPEKEKGKPRSTERLQSLNPLHYLPILRQKPHELDHAKAFAHWNLPLIYQRFCEELERRHGDGGLRKYIEILTLLGQFSQNDVTNALRWAHHCRTYTPEAVLMHLRLAEQQRSAQPLDTSQMEAVPAMTLPATNTQCYEALAI